MIPIREKSLTRSSLVLTRVEGNEVFIGDPANPIGIIKIVSVNKGKVKILFDFKKEVRIMRKEIIKEIA